MASEDLIGRPEREREQLKKHFGVGEQADITAAAGAEPSALAGIMGDPTSMHNLISRIRPSQDTERVQAMAFTLTQQAADMQQQREAREQEERERFQVTPAPPQVLTIDAPVLEDIALSLRILSGREPSNTPSES